MKTPTELLFPNEVFQIQGAVFEVYRTMGAGFLEGVYQECLTLELGRRSVPFEAHRALGLEYKAQNLRQSYVADFV